MYSKEEAQRIKREFWVSFAEKYPRKWILYDTKIKDFSFKFFVDNKKIQVSLDIECRNETLRLGYFEKLVALKSILEEDYIKDLIFEQNYTLESGKTISRIWVEKIGLGFSKPSDWNTIFDFFNLHMDAFENFYSNYDEYIKNV
jgi:hypothetical protein